MHLNETEFSPDGRGERGMRRPRDRNDWRTRYVRQGKDVVVETSRPCPCTVYTWLPDVLSRRAILTDMDLFRSSYLFYANRLPEFWQNMSE